MGYSTADEAFTHQFPTTFDKVYHPGPTRSHRCDFFAAPTGRHHVVGQWLRQQPQHRQWPGLCCQGQPRRWPPLEPARRAVSPPVGTQWAHRSW